MLVLSPTLLDITAFIGIGLAEVATIMMLRTVGSGIGAVITGVLMDRFASRLSLWLLVFSTITLAIVTAVLPLSNLLVLFSVCMFVQGLALGSLENGIHTLLIKLWKSTNTGPAIQMIHFTFAFGAFLIPLVSTPFITRHLHYKNCHFFSTSSECRNHLVPANYCIPSDGSGLYNESSDSCIMSQSIKFRYVYWIATIPLLISLPGLLFYSIKQECCFNLKKCTKHDSEEIEEEDETNDEQENDETPRSYPDTKIYAVAMIIIAACFIFVYVGLEVAFGTYLFTYAVEGEPQFTKKTATILSSLFWGTFSFLRLISMVLTLCKVPPSILLTGNLIGSLIASIVMLIWPESKIATWIGSALMGTSFASVFPNSIVWLSYNAPVNGISIGIVGIAVTTGEALLSTAVGVLIDMIGPASFTYYNLAAVIVSLLLFYAMLGLAQICKVKNSHTAKNYKPLEMEIVNNHTSNNQITLCKSQ
jgi:FHS family Na+ dependent glucose MFS transporter 1